jgi:hypothetical protein
LKCDEKETKQHRPFEPESPYVVICEGFHELGLVCALLKHLDIENCDVTYPKKVDGGNGKDAIGNVIQLLVGRMPSVVKGVLVVTDADDNPDKAFKEIKEKFCAPFPKPTSSFVIQKTNRYRSGVFLTPGNGKKGALEHLLLEAANEASPTSLNCIETLRNCTNTTLEWKSNKVAKMKLACYIATHCENDPCCSPAFIWTSKNRLFDPGSSVFSELANVLRNFVSDDGAANNA